jgi:hypothetical protein
MTKKLIMYINKDVCSAKKQDRLFLCKENNHKIEWEIYKVFI